MNELLCIQLKKNLSKLLFALSELSGRLKYKILSKTYSLGGRLTMHVKFYKKCFLKIVDYISIENHISHFKIKVAFVIHQRKY